MNVFQYGIISYDPLVMIHPLLADESVLTNLSSVLPEEGVCRFITHFWYYPVSHIVRFDEMARKYRPQDTIIHLVNDRSIYEELGAISFIQAEFAHQNMFLNERVFRIMDIPKTYDAVCNSRMRPWKRHHLTVEIQSLMLIGTLLAERDTQEYFEQIRRDIPHAYMPNWEANRVFRKEEIARLVNQCHVGLLLSEEEGGNFATTEYSLCGLPVISTPSRGGRISMLDMEYDRIVSPDKEMIAEVVQDLKHSKVDPRDIRQRTLDKIVAFRAKFCELGQRYYSAKKCGRDFSADFYSRFYNNNFLQWKSVGQIRKTLTDYFDENSSKTSLSQSSTHDASEFQSNAI